MKRLSLVVALSVVCSIPAFSQAPAPGAPRPGLPTPTGAQAPGLPPRDNRAAQPQTGTALIRGRVVAAQTGQPLRRAQITLASSAAPTGLRRSTTTDGEGRFEFKELPAGTFSLTANKTGYVNLQYGQRRPFEQGTPIPLADGQVLEKVDFSLPRGGVIVIRVSDDFAEPIAGAQVQIQRYQYQADGQRRLSTVQSGISGLAMTDDRGELRGYGLMPGEYIVSASLRALGAPGASNDAGEGFSPTFFPGVINADQAVPVSIRVGEEATAQFSLIASRLSRLSGIVVDSEGRPVAGAALSMVTRTATSMSSSGAGVTGPDGSFTIGGVSPGDHSIDVRPRPVLGATGGGEYASLPVTVGGADITGLRIVTGAGALVSGRVVFEGGAAPADGATRRVMLQQADPSRQMAMVGLTDSQRNGTLDADGRFEIAGAAGRVFFNVNAAVPAPTVAAWNIKSVTLDGRNITDEPLELSGRTSVSDVSITMTDKQTTVSGQVGDGRGQVLRDYVVVILPAEDKEPVIAARYIRTVRPNIDGRFETRGLRPGRYVATAIEALEQGRQFAPEFQGQLRRGAREFTVGEGQSVTLDLRLTPDL